MAITAPQSPSAAPVAPHRRGGLGNADYRAGLRYLTFGRAFPTLLFGFMGWLQFQKFQATFPAHSLGDVLNGPLPRGLYLLFCAVPAGIYLTRPRPTASDARVLPRVVAFVATTMQLAVGAFAPDSRQLLSPPAWFGPISTALFIAAFAFALWGLAYLRRSLSIVPEARRLTTSGPYRYVRHPLYCGELLAAFAIILPTMKLIPVLAVTILVGLQITRTVFEEALLTSVFPEYAAYARRTRRLIPFVV